MNSGLSPLHCCHHEEGFSPTRDLLFGLKANLLPALQQIPHRLKPVRDDNRWVSGVQPLRSWMTTFWLCSVSGRKDRDLVEEAQAPSVGMTSK